MFCVLFDMGMSAIMFIIGILFYKSNGKATNFLSGYNMRSTEERKKYDEIQMCKDYGKRMMYMAIPFLIGAVIDIQFVGIGCLIAWGLWLVLFAFLLKFTRYIIKKIPAAITNPPTAPTTIIFLVLTFCSASTFDG